MAKDEINFEDALLADDSDHGENHDEEYKGNKGNFLLPNTVLL